MLIVDFTTLMGKSGQYDAIKELAFVVDGYTPYHALLKAPYILPRSIDPKTLFGESLFTPQGQNAWRSGDADYYKTIDLLKHYATDRDTIYCVINGNDCKRDKVQLLQNIISKVVVAIDFSGCISFFGTVAKCSHHLTTTTTVQSWYPTCTLVRALTCFNWLKKF